MTRLADLGVLDRSRPFVFGAVTPLARDLTTHLGKGVTRQDARVSAMMEAIERASGEHTPNSSCLAPYSQLSENRIPVIDPRRFALPPTSEYNPDRHIRWTPGIRLPDGDPVWLATDLVVCPPSDHVTFQPDTNGLAAGNTLAEACLHGICEVIERDAIGRFLFARLHGDPGEVPKTRRIDTISIPRDSAKLIQSARENGHDFTLYEFGDLDIPVVAAFLTDPAYPTSSGTREMSFFGFGCAPSSATALRRALTEAQQSRVSILQGARDSFNTLPYATEPETEVTVEFASLPGAPESTDLLEDIDFVIAKLNAAGFRDIYLSDLTRLDLAIPVVRVLIPGMSVFLVDRSRVGWRDLACLV